MIDYDLPTSVTVGEREYPIRTDYRAALDIIAALSDPELNEYEKAAVLCGIFYTDDVPEDINEAIRACFWFISGGDYDENQKSQPKVMDWEQDFRWIVAPINKAIGRDIRGMEIHWWTFLSYYYEIGDCSFAQIVAIRKKLSKGQKLDKGEIEYYRNNRNIVDIKNKYTADEEAMISALTKKG